MPKKNAQILTSQTIAAKLKLEALTPPSNLPISSVWKELVEAVRLNQVVVITGETGSGKSTQLPKVALLAGQGRLGRIVCTQPRRVAARSLARRVADEFDAAGLGASLVGYKIRFKSDVTGQTLIKFVTDGILLAELRSDRWLREYDTIIVDEAHERSLNIDLLLGLSKDILKKRPDMKLIVTSATIEPKRFSEAFGNAPVLNIPGRGFPVEKRYIAPEMLNCEQDAPSVDLAVSAVRQLLREGRTGDILVFFATEKEIREAASHLSASVEMSSFQGSALVLPMYGRLSAGDQDLIFKPSSRRKIVLATNIAETSITVPGIRYVVDTGFARISRYSAGSRTKALPVSRISRSSADQRAGRAGRTAPGVCLRLYGEEDYISSLTYTPPEILRSNLAEVILKLLDIGVNDVERFPFIDAPHPALVKEGFSTLRELGAVKPEGTLTENGRLMAKLPLDPRLSRILIQANQERCLKEAVVLAAALSIQDPREYPVDKKAQADQAHAVFRSTDSDFITLLNIWQMIKECEKQGVSRTKLRKYCKEHFLSYPRLLEWKDIYDQIVETLAEAGGFSLNQKPANYEAIHRSLLTGFLSNIGIYKEGTKYRGAKEKEVFLFPGSSLYKKRPKWLMCAELVKTSQLYARIAAEIKPEWVEQVAGEFAKRSWADAHWEKERGEVVAWEKVTVFGLTVVESRKISYSRIKPDEAKDIFVREAIFTGAFKKRFAFVEHNNAVFSEIETISSKTRRADLCLDEEAAIELLSQGLSELERKIGKDLIADERSLAWAIKKHGDKPLCLDKELLLSEAMKQSDLGQYPGHLIIDGLEVPLVYSFSPGSEKDGVTAQIPAQHMERIACATMLQFAGMQVSLFEWLVPAMLSGKTLAILKSLSKQFRQRFQPLPETAEEIARRLQQQRLKNRALSLEEAFVAAIFAIFSELQPNKAQIFEEITKAISNLPSHFRMRFEIISPSGRIMAAGRDLAHIEAEITLDVVELQRQSPIWRAFVSKWEKELSGIDGLSPLPERIRESKTGFEGFPALSFEDGRLFQRVFLQQKNAEMSQKQAIKALFLRELSKEFSYLLKQVNFSDRFIGTGSLSLKHKAFLADKEVFKANFASVLERELLPQTLAELDSKTFFDTLNILKKDMMLKGLHIINAVQSVLESRAKAMHEIERLYAGCTPKTQAATVLKKGLEKEIARLVPADFPCNMSLIEIERIPRYLEGVRIRAKRGFDNPLKDRAKAEQVSKYLERLQELAVKRDQFGDEFDKLALMVNEYVISVFAPELKTLFSISAKKLDGVIW